MQMPESTHSTVPARSAPTEPLVATEDDVRNLKAERLRQEIDKLQRERDVVSRDVFQRSAVWGAVAPLLSALTPLIAIVSLAVGWSTEASKREYEQFYSQMSLLTSEGQVAKQKSALITLTPYWRDSRYRTELRRVVLEQMLTDRSDEVRRLMLAELLRDSSGIDEELLSTIGERNRDIARQYRLRVGSDRFHSAVFASTAGLPFLQAFAADSLTQQIAHSLVWAVRALVRALNEYPGEVPAINLDGVMLSIPVWRVEAGDTLLRNEDDELLRPGISFRGTRLRGAQMATIRLTNATLIDVVLDSALLCGAVVEGARVSGSSSARNLDTRLKVAILEKDASRPTFEATACDPVTLRDSQISASDLSINAFSSLQMERSSIQLTNRGSPACSGNSPSAPCAEDHALVQRPPDGRDLNMVLQKEKR